VVDSQDFKKYRLFDIWLNTLTLGDILSVLRRNITQRRRFILANQNLHGLYICMQDEKARAFFESADYTHIDGTGLLWLGKLAGLPFKIEHRAGYMDLFPAMLPDIIQNQWRVFYLGSEEKILERGLARLRRDQPGLQIEGHHGYFAKGENEAENERVINLINEYKPDILFVGMGMPIQEWWILDNFEKLNVCAIFHCGGMMDYIAGQVPTPPRWLGPMGLEWAFRLVTEPARLGKRYLIEPFQLIGLLLAHKYRASRSSPVRNK
jgi:N-acetylglucosaminyldiphosphoundecaprenol N-acetyl-beta-D-mannosaminyltransferase